MEARQMDTIVEKLRKLIAHEESARSIGSQAEAEAFANRISRLLTEHKLTMSDVEVVEQQKSDPFGQESVTGTGWRTTMAQGIAEAMYCKLLRIQSRLIFLGRESDRRAAVEMYTYLGNIGEQLGTKGAKAFTDSPAFRDALRGFGASLGEMASATATERRKWKASFLRGYGLALYSRMHGEQQQLAASPTGSAMVLRESVALAAFVKQAYPQLAKGRASSYSISNSGAYSAGQAVGRSVGLKSRLALGA